MLSEMLQDDTGFIARDWVDGALLVTPIKGMCNRDFSARGINKLLSPLDIKISCISYVKPRAEAPCLYGTCHILGEIISVESMFSWSDLKRMRRDGAGLFMVWITMENDTGLGPRLVLSFEVETEPMRVVTMSPVLNIIKAKKEQGD